MSLLGFYTWGKLKCMHPERKIEETLRERRMLFDRKQNLALIMNGTIDEECLFHIPPVRLSRRASEMWMAKWHRKSLL